MSVQLSRVKKTMKLVAYLISFFILGVITLFILVDSIFPNQTLNIFRIKPYVVEYNTMDPVIKPNDLVFIRKIDTNQIEVGEFITFEAAINYDGNYQMVTYYVDSYTVNQDQNRVYRVIPENSNVPYAFSIQSSSVVGGYSFRIPWIGNIVKFVSSSYGIAAIVTNIVVITSVILVVKHSKKEKLKTPQ